MPEKKLYQLITFDVYTALFDIETSLLPAVNEMFGASIDGLTFIRAWRRKQLELALISNSLQRPRIPFEQLTHSALDDTLIRSKLETPESLRTHLTHLWLTLLPWPEAPRVLAALKTRGYRMGLLSNGDLDALHTLAQRLPPVFEHIFSSEQAGYYKPHPGVYALPLETLHLHADEVLHVAGSATDALGTKSVGLHCAWSNRNHDPHIDPNLRADYEMSDLSELLQIL